MIINLLNYIFNVGDQNFRTEDFVEQTGLIFCKATYSMDEVSTEMIYMKTKKKQRLSREANSLSSCQEVHRFVLNPKFHYHNVLYSYI
jgi:hypothetical protein